MIFDTDQALTNYYQNAISDLVKSNAIINDDQHGNNLWASNTYGNTFSFNIKCAESKNIQIAGFSLEKMPSCDRILLSTHSWVSRKYQKIGLGTLLNQMRIDIAKRLGYKILMCTNREDNIAQRRILSKNGWKDIYTMPGDKLTDNVYLSVIDL